ncbi:MAG: DUF4919 domain-containing protein [Novosphingobium sp.]
MIRYALAISLFGFSSVALADQPILIEPVPAPSTELPAPPKSIAKALKSGDGLTEKTAYKVSSVRQEYEILRYLGLEPRMQALVINKKAYDVITAVDPATGKERKVWFNISSFYGRF